MHLDIKPFVGTKSLVELHLLAVCKLFGVDVNDVLINELGVLVLPFPTSEIKLLNCTGKPNIKSIMMDEVKISHGIIPCCGRDVGDGDGAGDALLELGHSDTSDPFDLDILEFRPIGALAEDV